MRERSTNGAECATLCGSPEAPLGASDDPQKEQAMAITLKDIEKLGDVLKKVPAPAPEEQALTKQEAMEKLKPAIEGMRAKGHSFEKIAATLTENGFKTSANAIRGLLEGKKKRPKKKT